MNAIDTEFIIVGQDQGTSFTLWDVVPAPTDRFKRDAYLEELGMDAMDAFGDVTTEWAESPRAAVAKLLSAMREQSGICDYGLTADSNTDCLGPEPEPATDPTPYGHARALGGGYRITAFSEPGLSSIVLEGLPGRYAIETRDRIRAGVVNSGLNWPGAHLTVKVTRLTAADRRVSSGLDLAAACATLAAAGEIPADCLAGAAMIGELGLDGRVRTPATLLGQVRAAAANGAPAVIVPAGAAREAGRVPGVRVIGVGSLNDALAVLSGCWHHTPDCTHCKDEGGPHRPCTGRQPCPDCCVASTAPAGA